MPCDLMFNADDEFEFITEAVLVFDRDLDQAWDLDGCNEALEAWYNSTLDPPSEDVLDPFLGDLTEAVASAIRQLMGQEATPDEYAPFLYPLTHDTGLDYGLWIAPSEDGFGLDSERRHSVLKEMQDIAKEEHKRHTDFKPRRYEAP